VRVDDVAARYRVVDGLSRLAAVWDAPSTSRLGSVIVAATLADVPSHAYHCDMLVQRLSGGSHRLPWRR
jgi:hypothetical protein